MSFFSDIFSFVAQHWLSAVVFIGIFSVLIILHELGHFWAARKAGVGVLEFGFGLPPKVWGKKTSRTIFEKDAEGKIIEKTEDMEWTLNAIPFGGFVRLEGEEEKSDAPNAFSNRPLGWRILVVCGGVIMNFVLGWGLLTIGYGVGMNPLSPSDAQKEEYVETGLWTKEEDKVVLSHLPKGMDDYGLQYFDIVEKVDGNSFVSPEDFNTYLQIALSEGKKEVPVQVRRFDTSTQEFVTLTQNIPVLEHSVFTSSAAHVVIKEVIAGSPAQAIGFLEGDIITGVEQGTIVTANQFIQTVARHFADGKKRLRVSVLRTDADGSEKTLTFIAHLDTEGKMGIMIGNILTDGDEDKILLESRSLYIPVHHIQYPWLQAPVEAYKESFRWMGLSLDMVSNVFSTIISDQKIPEGVGGPVAIADTTDKLVDHGDWTKILQFTAILSLSLAVVNIMPFPGLDGGRLFFLIGEGILRMFATVLFWAGVRKREIPTQLPEKYEMPLHAVGYFLLLGLILWITWNDIVRIFF